MRRRARPSTPQPVKSISHEMLLGQKGMNMAEAVVLAMGYVWNPIHIESGIDAVIEIRDPATGETGNKIVQVQVKAVSKFAAEGDDAFSFSCERAHIGYWLGGTARVILVVCRPDSGEIYWKDLQTYFSRPENVERSTVRFSKKADVFEASCRTALLTVAQPEGGLALGPLPKAEKLLSNLFLLSGYPPDIVATPTKEKTWEGFVKQLKEAKKPWLQEQVWVKGTMYSFFYPLVEGLDDLCEGPSDTFPTARWADSDDLVTQRHFAELLGKAFSRRCYKQDLKRDHETGIFYFMAPVDGAERKITTRSLVNNTSKTVVSKHSSVREDGTPSVYYKHHAFFGRIRRFGGQWYFELTPTYHFTEDGVKTYANAEALLKGIKRLERHAAVLGSFLVWKEYLTDSFLFDFRYQYLKLTPPGSLPIDRGIDDRAWRLAGAAEDAETATVVVEEAETSEADDEDEGGLFSWKST